LLRTLNDFYYSVPPNVPYLSLSLVSNRGFAAFSKHVPPAWCARGAATLHQARRANSWLRRVHSVYRGTAHGRCADVTFCNLPFKLDKRDAAARMDTVA